MTTIKNTIVYFHIGRGGRYHNSGHVTFYGQKNIKEVLRMLDSGKHWNFIAKENESKIYRMLKKRGLKNLLALFEKCRDNDDFEIFEKKTGLKLGEDIYTDGNGDELITVAQVETGCGTLDWDGDYDTDICKLLSDCDADDLQLIADSNEYGKEELIEEYFDDHTDLDINWTKFNGDYSNLIDDYFNDPIFSIEDMYEVEEDI